MSTTTDIQKPSDKAADAPQPAKRRIAFRKLLSWLVVVVVVAFGIYWFKFRPTPVTAQAVATGEVRSEVMGTGTLEARVKTTISPRIQERLEEVQVDQGDRVTSGQLLARLDDAETQQQPARVVFRSEPAKNYVGEVARLGRKADRETREFVVDVSGVSPRSDSGFGMGDGFAGERGRDRRCRRPSAQIRT